MSSILDIDLAYFAVIERPLDRLKELLYWGGRPVTIVTDRHHEVLSCWKTAQDKGTIATPSHILHVDEHHDMMDEQRRRNIANFVYHAMLLRPSCRLFWLVDYPYGLEYTGVTDVQHEYFYAVWAASDQDRKEYLERAYQLGHGF